MIPESQNDTKMSTREILATRRNSFTEAGFRQVNVNLSTFAEIAALGKEDYIHSAQTSMMARFSAFVVTPEQQRAWEIGFGWIHDLATQIGEAISNWLVLPEYAAPLVSGRPDLVVVCNSHLFVIEMKTGNSSVDSSGRKQVLEYATTLWGKLKAAKSRTVVAILLSPSTSDIQIESLVPQVSPASPTEVLMLSPWGLKDLFQKIADLNSNEIVDREDLEKQLIYSPRPSVIEAAIALVAGTEDRNVITGLSNEDELHRVTSLIQELAADAQAKREKRIVVITGSPGAGKTLVGLRLAHDRTIQGLLPAEAGTPLYLTGNGPLVDVLVESLARDEVRRRHIPKREALSNADAKIRLIHAITQTHLKIESNVIIFDEGQRVWTAKHMRRKKADDSLGSEAEELLSYLEEMEWALAIVLIGEGQEINTGEAGLSTWLDAVRIRNGILENNWKITSPQLFDSEAQIVDVDVDNGLRLTTIRRTDNAADVSGWAEAVLNHHESEAQKLRELFADFPIYLTRDLEAAKNWIRAKQGSQGGSIGFLASSKSRRLFKFGLDTVADAGRSFKWQNWYLNKLPDLNSSEALEIVATEYKCQGLELDWVTVCWSWDLVSDGHRWIPRSLNLRAAKWARLNANANYQVNAYRVLLTRSRRGMVIWVPEGDAADPSMSPQEMDSVAQLLADSGLTYL